MQKISLIKVIRKNVLICFILLVLIFSIFLPTINAISISNAQNSYENLIKKFESQDGENICDLIVICPREFVDDLEPLKQHKEKMGIKTKIVSLNKVYTVGFDGRDNPEKIKIFIRERYNDWNISYVLLVGDYKKIPVRYVFNADRWHPYPESCFISELYYADLYDEFGNFQDWDTNKNGVFGEWIGDIAEDPDIDLRPDVCVGRLACKNKIEVRTMVRKIIRYETTTYGKQWFNRIVAIAGDTYHDKYYDFPTPELEGEEHSKRILENMSGFETIELFISNGNFSSPFDVIRAFMKGAGFISMTGHGNPKTWSSHPPNSSEWINGLNLLSIMFLFNFNKLPIVVAGSCHNGQFDVNLRNYISHPEEAKMYGIGAYECTAWKLTRKIGGGAIATVANTATGLSKEDKESQEGAGDYIDLQFFLEYNNGSDILGDCWAGSINRYLDAFPVDWNTPAAYDFTYDAKTVQQWTLFGDPSLKIGGYPQS